MDLSSSRPLRRPGRQAVNRAESRGDYSELGEQTQALDLRKRKSTVGSSDTDAKRRCPLDQLFVHQGEGRVESGRWVRESVGENVERTVGLGAGATRVSHSGLMKKGGTSIGESSTTQESSGNVVPGASGGGASWSGRESVQSEAPGAGVPKDPTSHTQAPPTPPSPSTSPSPSHHRGESSGEEWQSAGEADEEIGGSTGEAVENLYELKRAGKPKRFKKAVVQKRYRIKMLNSDQITAQAPEVQLQLLTEILTGAFRRLKKKVPKDSVVFTVVENKGFTSRAFTAPRTTPENLKFRDIADSLLGRLASDESIQLENTVFTLVAMKKKEAGQVQLMGGGGWRGCTMWSRTEPDCRKWLAKKRSALDPARPSAKLPVGYHNMCMPLCLSTAIWRYDNPALSKFLRYEVSRRCRDSATELVRRAGLTPEKGPFSIAQVGEIHKVIGDEYEIIILDENGIVMQSFGSPQAPRPIYLLFIQPEGGGRGGGAAAGDESVGEVEEGNELGLEVGEAQVGQPARPPQRESLCSGAIVGHCILVTSVTGFTGTPYFCRLCKKGYNGPSRKVHHCPASKCRKCGWAECKNTDRNPPLLEQQKCHICGFFARTKACFTEHEANGRCGLYKWCDVCGITEPKGKSVHKCGQVKCANCGTVHLMTSPCFVARPKTVNVTPVEEGLDAECGGGQTRTVWYADMEATIDGEGTHHPALLVAQRGGRDGRKAEQGQQKQKKTKSAEKSESQQVVCWGRSCAEQFLEIACSQPRFKNSTVFFHNLARYDGSFLLQAALSLRYRPKGVIMNGSSLLTFSLAANRVTFKDSYLFIQAPLSTFTSLFSLGRSGEKGLYPYKLGPQWLEPGVVYEEEGRRFPALKYFGPESMSAKKRAEVTAWVDAEEQCYEKDQARQYKARDEMLAYCHLDVTILRRGFESFLAAWHKDCPELTPLDYVTLPSFANAVYRLKFMPHHPAPTEERAIAIVPPEGYQPGRFPQSLAAFGWLAWTYEVMGLTEVRDSRHGGEVQLGLGLSVDGFGQRPDGSFVALQFNGCWYHKCDTCYPEKSDENEGARKRSQLSLERLKRLGRDPRSPFPKFDVICTRQCEWDRERRGNPNAYSFVNRFRQTWSRHPLKPRDSLFGGRTNAIHHLVDVETLPGSRIIYLDFVSLYPAVQASLRGEVWPLGLPRILIGLETKKADAPVLGVNALGLWKCRVLPPKSLRFPVLPVRLNSKLYFPLCSKCAEEEQQGKCGHSSHERSISGTWCTPELKLAQDNGYEIVEVYEMWQWDASTTTLFTGMMKHFYRAKAIASQPPKTDAEMKTLQRNLKETLNIDLTREDFKPSATARAIAKGALNSIWGYFAKSGKMETVEFVESAERLAELETDETSVVTQIRVEVEDRLLRVHSRPVLEKANKAGSIVIAALVTSYARIKLYEELLQPFEKHALYFDTDSCILWLPEGVEGPPTGSAIGMLTDEYPEYDIHGFAATGPKSYSLKMRHRETGEWKCQTRCKGISLNAEAQVLTTHAKLAALVTDPVKEIRVPQHQIGRAPNDSFRLFSRQFAKRLRFTSSKRAFVNGPNPTFDTRPYGLQ